MELDLVFDVELNVKLKKDRAGFEFESTSGPESSSGRGPRYALAHGREREHGTGTID